jgi:uncharacterized membrane protein
MMGRAKLKGIEMEALLIATFGFFGIAFILGMCIVEMYESAKHQRWIEANNARRFAKGE